MRFFQLYNSSEGEVTVQIILFEKYQVERVVYESDTTTIYLVEHIYMSSRRIIKKILKESIHRNSFYSEISILKNIKHPNIPIIYDTQEDDNAYYIIEEYVEGINLVEYIREHGVLTEKDAAQIGVKICEIISYLHSQKPIPILFLDLQPKNILIQNEKIYLVDFGSSFYLNDASNRKLLIGTTGYAAPEQYTYEGLDERADIYGIGAVLYFMIAGRGCGQRSTKSLEFPNIITGKYRAIVEQCISAKKEHRLQDVGSIIEELSELSKEDRIYSDENKPQIITVIGTQNRVGVTTISIALAVWLSENGYKTVYEEANESNHLRILADALCLKYDKGYFIKNKLLLKPFYGSWVQLFTECKYIVRDCGTDEKQFVDGDIMLIVGGAKPWEAENSAMAFRNYASKAVFLLSLSTKKQSDTLWTKVGRSGFLIPYINDVFVLNDNVKANFKELFITAIKDRAGGEKDKKKTRLFEKFAKKAGCYSHRNNRSV